MSAGSELGEDEPETVDLAERTESPATVLDRPSRRPADSAALAQSSSESVHGRSDAQSTIATPLDALRRDEVLRTRRFAVVALLIAVVGTIGTAILPGDPLARAVLLAAIGCAAPAMIYILVRTRDPPTYGGPRIAIAWYVAVASVGTAVPYYGVFSPAPVLLVLGTYFVGLGSSRALATSVYLTCAASQGIVAALVITGTIRDTGIVRLAPMAQRDQIVIQLLVQFILALTFIIARTSRGTALQAVGELERAVRAMAQREAVLQEAREELERALRPGRGRFTEQTFGGYRLGVVIGRGAMGEVYEAVDTRTQAVFAVKMLSQASLGNPSHVRRFLRELSSTAALDSPHVVRVIETGESPVPYLVMERLHGRNLAEILRGQRGLPTRDVADLVRQVGRGIAVAADAGIVHRDLKPQNLFRDGGTWKILDFGVSRLLDHGETLTAGHVIGTPAYMAPEQARGEPVDHRADLYAIAAIAYRALTGHPPFTAGDVAEMLYRVVHAAPRRPTALATLPADVDLVLAIGLARQPDRRFATAAELADALDAALTGSLPDPVRERGRALERAGAWSD